MVGYGRFSMSRYMEWWGREGGTMGRGRMTCWGGLDEGVQLPKARQAHPEPDAHGSPVRPFVVLLGTPVDSACLLREGVDQFS